MGNSFPKFTQGLIRQKFQSSLASDTINDFTYKWLGAGGAEAGRREGEVLPELDKTVALSGDVSIPFLSIQEGDGCPLPY